MLERGNLHSASEFEINYYECEDCTDCPYKNSCTPAKGNRKMQLSIFRMTIGEKPSVGDKKGVAKLLLCNNFFPVLYWL